MESHPHNSPEKLADQVAWIRALARELVGDAHLAEDLAQETMVSVLGSGPRDPSKLRAWLAAVMRNLLRQKRRGASRRAQRETWVSRDPLEDQAESADSVVEPAPVDGELVAAVLALDEPYRTAVLSRYFDDLEPRAIAARLGIPTATVKSRLKRGLHKLRETLSARKGARWPTWALGVFPPTVPLPAGTLSPNLPPAASPSAASATTGIALVNSKIVLSSVVIAAAGIVTHVAIKQPAPVLDSPRSSAPTVLTTAPAERAFAVGEFAPHPAATRDAPRRVASSSPACRASPRLSWA